MKSVFFILLFCIVAPSIKAQQRAQFTQFMLNKYYENPAYGGMDRSLSVSLMYRDQFTAFNGSPKNFIIGGHMPFYLWNGALGFQLSDQRVGLMRHSAVTLSYNYVFGTDFGLVSLGGRVGGDFINVNGGGIITPDGNYEGGADHNDPILNEMPFSGLGLTYQAGAYFFSNTVEAGISIGEWPPYTASITPADYKKSGFANFYFEYKYKLDQNRMLSAGLLVKADRAVIQTDLFALYRIRGGLFGGLSLRGYNSTSLDAVNIIIGSKINDHLSMSYSYDIGLSGLRNVHDGSHEIVMSYNLNKLIGIGLPPKIIYSPRYM